MGGVVRGMPLLGWCWMALAILCYLQGLVVWELFSDCDTWDAVRDQTGWDMCRNDHPAAPGVRYNPYFGNALKSMYMIGRCSVGDCSTLEGLPLIPRLTEHMPFIATA